MMIINKRTQSEHILTSVRPSLKVNAFFTVILLLKFRLSGETESRSCLQYQRIHVCVRARIRSHVQNVGGWKQAVKLRPFPTGGKVIYNILIVRIRTRTARSSFSNQQLVNRSRRNLV